MADGDEPRVTPAPTDTPARLARSEGAVKALSGQLSCAPALPVAARPEAVSGHAGLLAPPGTGPRGAGAAMSGSGGALWGSAPGGPGGGMGIEVAPPGAGGRLAPPGIGAREAYFGGCIVFGAAIGEGPNAKASQQDFGCCRALGEVI